MESKRAEKVRRFVQRTTSASSIEEVVDSYSDWAKTYDQDLEELGNSADIAVQEIAFILDDHLEAKILDLAAGTGTIGKMLYEKGYTNIDAIDASQEMLNIAKSKGIYKSLICEFVSEKKMDIMPDTYDVIVGCGCLSDSQVSFKSFPELIRITKKGGHIIFLSSLEWFDNDKYEPKMDRLVKLKMWRRSATKYIPKYWGNDMGICYTMQKL